jgi:hypothetical protein
LVLIRGDQSLANKKSSPSPSLNLPMTVRSQSSYKPRYVNQYIKNNQSLTIMG